MDLNYRYIIPIIEEEIADASFFRGFTPEILRVADLICGALMLPVHPVQFLMGRERVMQQRMMGSGHSIMPLQCNALPHALPSETAPLCCIISSPETLAASVAFCKVSTLPVLHISTDKTADAIHLHTWSAEDFQKHIQEVLRKLPNENAGIRKLRLEVSQEWRPWPPIELPDEGRHHGVTLPNEMPLESFGFYFKRVTPLASTSEQEYIDAIIKSAIRVVEVRNKTLKDVTDGWFMPPNIDLILAAPGMFRKFHTGKAPWNRRHKKEDEHIRKALRAVSKQTSYMTIFSSEGEPTSEERQTYASVVSHLGREARAYNAAITIRAAHTLAPVLRLPPRVNLAYEDMNKLGDCIRNITRNTRNATHQNLKKMNRLARHLSENLLHSIPQEFLSFIQNHGKQIKLITDIPLELLQIDGLPLSIRYETSRLPATPGNIMLQQCLFSHRIFIDPVDFNEILVIRSFAPGDAVADLLAQAINVTRKHQQCRINVRFVDVSTVEEFISACESYSGPLLIFDGHGAHDAQNDIGFLRIGKNNIDVRSLRGKVRMPPAVILSACDTHPPDRSHASTGTGFLTLGAVTVFASMLPVDGRHAAIFLARLLLRLEAYLPIMTEEIGESVTWSDMMWSLQRMMYVTELLFSMRKQKFEGLEPQIAHDLLFQNNKSITRFDPHWWEKLASNFCNSTGTNREDFDAFVREHHQFPDVLKYVQLGNPEQLIFAGRNFKQLSESA